MNVARFSGGLGVFSSTVEKRRGKGKGGLEIGELDDDDDRRKQMVF